MAKQVIRLTESYLNSIVRSSINKILNEDKEGRNMRHARNAIKKYCPNATNDNTVWGILNAIRNEIPYSRIYECKYLCGVIRLVYVEELGTQEMDVINDILEILSKDSRLANAYDGDFNGLYYEELMLKFHDRIQNLINDERQALNFVQSNANQYTIIPINAYNDIKRFSPYTEWCITKSESDFDNYINHGQRFYICLKKDFERIQAEKADNYPLDDYGLSMLAISVYPNGRLATSTTRWNEVSMGNRTLNVQQISNLIGKNFYDVFKPNEQPN